MSANGRAGRLSKLGLIPKLCLRPTDFRPCSKPLGESAYHDVCVMGKVDPCAYGGILVKKSTQPLSTKERDHSDSEEGEENFTLILLCVIRLGFNGVRVRGLYSGTLGTDETVSVHQT